MTCIHSHPKDIAAVQIGGKTYIFFVNKDDRLCYTVKPGGDCNGDFGAKAIEIQNGMTIKPESRQVAAVAWVPKDAAGNPKKEQWEIRVYCICKENEKGYLQEVCLSSKDKANWYQGIMGCSWLKRYVDDGSSLAALGTTFENLQVFVSGQGENGMPKIDIHSYNPAGQGDWDVQTIRDYSFAM